MKSSINLVVIDSNFILLPFQFKIDYFNEIRMIIEGHIRFIIFQQIFNELDSKRQRKQKATNFTRFYDSGLLYLEQNKKKYEIIIEKNLKRENETTDDFILRMLNNLKMESQNVYLATNDAALRKKAKLIDINTIFLRQKKYLSIN
ncbi:MAG: PIN domain-containing protein [Promethearchaeota archaeon]